MPKAKDVDPLAPESIVVIVDGEKAMKNITKSATILTKDDYRRRIDFRNTQIATLQSMNDDDQADLDSLEK